MTTDALCADIVQNPSSGLPKLLTALEQPSQEESNKTKVPLIFEMLPDVMKSLSVDSVMPMVTACHVIVCCVRLLNDAAIGGAHPVINGAHVKQCQEHLGAWMKAQIKAEHVYLAKNYTEDAVFSMMTKAIALATIALFKVENCATDCKRAMNKAGGVAVAATMLGDFTGISPDAKQALAQMLNSYVDQNSESVENITANRGIPALLQFLEAPSSSVAARGHIHAVLEACMTRDNKIANTSDIKNAIEISKNNKMSPKVRAKLSPQGTPRRA